VLDDAIDVALSRTSKDNYIFLPEKLTMLGKIVVL